MPDVIKVRPWTDEELITAGFRYFQRRKQLVMAGRLPEQAAPLEIHYPLESVIAEAGDVICFDATHGYHKQLLDYEHWSVKYHIFMATYRNWKRQDWHPDAAVRHLMAHGCKPYYKHHGTWARRLTEPTWVQSLESTKPMLIPVGMWLLIGTSGEPWHNEDAQFRERYIINEDSNTDETGGTF